MNHIGAGLFDEPLPELPQPQPQRTRWQPLRLGLAELYRYDSEEFWFRDGHLLLRGNNGTGKSKVLSLTLPLLLDAQLRSSRVEPDGDPGKKMAWNLLLGGAYERRTGYSWIEFARLDAHGDAQFVTLGVGLHALAARSHVDAWYFVVDGDRRLGRDLWLMSPQRLMHTREKLREAIGSAGQVFDSAQAYRRAVDERLFQLGPARYAALMDTLIQLRQPQLSRRPDEAALSAALTEALPPLPQDLLADVAEALTQLEEDRHQLEQARSLLAAVRRFEQQYRLYAGIASRRQARRLRQAQTEFDNSSRARHDAQQQLDAARVAEADSAERRQRAELMLAGARTRLETLQSDPLNTAANRLETAQSDAQQRERAVGEAQAELRRAGDELARDAHQRREAEAHAAAAADELARCQRASLAAAEACGVARELAAHRWIAEAPPALAASAESDAAYAEAQARLAGLVGQRREQLTLVRRRLAESLAAWREAGVREQASSEARAEAEDAAERRAHADADADAEALRHLDAWAEHLQQLQALQLDADAVLAALHDWLPRNDGEHPALAALHAAQGRAMSRLAAWRHALAEQRRSLVDEQAALQAERQRLERGEDAAPIAPAWRGEHTRSGVAGAPLWQLVDFDDALTPAERDGLEAALDAAGLLDAWVTPAGELLRGHDGSPWPDLQWLARPAVAAPGLAHWLRAAPGQGSVPAQRIEALLAGIAGAAEDPGVAEAWVTLDGRFRVAGLAGAAQPGPARFIGHAARAAARARRLDDIAARQAQVALALQDIQRQSHEAGALAARIDQEWRSAPTEQALRRANDAAAARQREARVAGRRAEEAEARWRQAEASARQAGAALDADATDLRLPSAAAALEAIDAQLHVLAATLPGVGAARRLLGLARAEAQRQAARAADAALRLHDSEHRLGMRRTEHEQARTRLAALLAAHGDDVKALKQRIAQARALVQRVEQARNRQDDRLRAAAEARARNEQRCIDASHAFEQCSSARAPDRTLARLRRHRAAGFGPGRARRTARAAGAASSVDHRAGVAAGAPHRAGPGHARR